MRYLLVFGLAACESEQVPASSASAAHTLITAVPWVPRLHHSVQTDATDYDLGAVLGLSQPANVVVTVQSGVTVSASGPGTPAFTTGTLPAGTTVRLVNRGAIRAAGGAGGGGGNGKTTCSSFEVPSITNGAPGEDGGTAIALTLPMSIDNSVGTIWGGGGGGGGGGVAYKDFCIWLGGGGGGGGAGTLGGAAGPGGSVSGSADQPGHPGVAGTATTGGLGGAGRFYNPVWSGQGGAGGPPGQDGADGEPGDYQYGPDRYDGGPGGAAGPAVDTQGWAVTWLGGSGSPNVEGPVW